MATAVGSIPHWDEGCQSGRQFAIDLRRADRLGDCREIPRFAIRADLGPRFSNDDHVLLPLGDVSGDV
jgi:hypothetical protein